MEILVDHLAESTFSASTEAASATSAHATSTAASAASSHLSLRLESRSILVEHGDHGVWSTVALPDLEHGVLVRHALLAVGAVVEVLAHGALVADTLDRTDTAAIALNVVVDNLLVVFVKNFILGVGETLDILLLDKILEDLLGLFLQFGLDQIFKSLAGDSLGGSLVFLALSFDVELFLLSHGLVLVLLNGGLGLLISRDLE